MPTVHNFSAGPAILPKPVLEKVQKDLLNYANTGCSVMELSHRGKEFTNILEKSQKDLRKLIDIPDNYHVLYMQGGATTQFSCIPMNLGVGKYLVTGSWSQKAFTEAEQLSKNDTTNNNKPTMIKLDDLSKKSSNFDNCDYFFYVSNETIGGVELPDNEIIDMVPNGIPVVCDMSSNILSRKIDVSKFGCIFAGAQKNIGPSGVTIVIIRDDLLTKDNTKETLPVMLNYKTFSKNNSVYNTPPTFAIYVAGLVFEYLLEIGGIQTAEENAKSKAGKVYDAINARPDTFSCPVDRKYQSRMNIPFRVLKNGSPDPDSETLFLKMAQDLNMVQLKGHRSVGGIRASLYNALPMESVDVLVDLMNQFKTQ